MKLKFLEAVEATDTGRRCDPPLRRVKIIPLVEAPADFGPDREFRVGLEFYIRSRASETELKARRSATLQYLREQAQRRLARELYGEVAEELFHIIEDMWDEGLPDHSTPVRRAERLLRLLAGDDQPPFGEIE